ncbi:Transcriptional regulator [Labilithrix luteola]|uniref:Transcriptional regulator n=1 Tax=Labilithrix luteola TaxID=1391654 RepID=A0A0K1PWE8_9BACT|nr:rhodanese-like domain-containing protein [Labilithrix luteola]AKU97850.1 Transcriptional regulator [Labilithrix luteola]
MVRSVAPRDAQELIAKGDIDVVDVRESHEWATGHVPEARLIPLGQLRTDFAGAELGKRVLFLCERGGRSQQAAQLAEQNGVAEVYIMDGGTAEWRASGLPITVPPKSAVEETTELDAIVGENLKRLRSERGWSLDIVAGMTGVGRQTLGQIELGRTVPSLGTLWKIARAFDVPFSVLLAQPTDLGTRIFRRSNARPILDADGRFSSRALFSPDDKGRFEFYELFLAARSREEAEAHAPGTRENLLVTQGRLVLELGKETFELAKGDAIAFTADVPHAYVNASNEECWMSLVMTYPRTL